MRIVLLAIIACLAIVWSCSPAIAADNGQPPNSGTPQLGQPDDRPMDRHGVIRPDEPSTRDPNQARVPGTRDNPNIFDRQKGFEGNQGLPQQKQPGPDSDQPEPR